MGYNNYRLLCSAPRLLLSVSLLLFFSSCRESGRIIGGRITIRNDILDKEYNTFVVDQVIAEGASVGFRKTLRPGDRVSIPHKNVQSMRFTRRYKDYSRVYKVECPDKMNDSIALNIIDVHSNRLAGGCELVKRGEIRNGTTFWEK